MYIETGKDGEKERGSLSVVEIDVLEKFEITFSTLNVDVAGLN